MASSNRHWPSMFKSKPSHHQWQPDLNSTSLLSSNPCHRNPYTPGHGCEERTPEPKPRWNPRPEQIRILEAIFNSGMVNPPRDEIRKIRAQLQEYGQVGDANVFYWFQNRKSRSKHKQRQLQNAAAQSQPQQTLIHPPPVTANTAAATFLTAPSSSSSSSNKSSPNNSSEKSISVGPTPTTVIHDLLNSPTASVNQQPFFQNSSEFLAEPFFFPVQQNTSVGSSVGFGFPGVADQSSGNCENFLLSELMLMSQCPNSKKDEDDEKTKLQQQLTYAAPNPNEHVSPPSFCFPPPNNQILQGIAESGPTKSTVFINDVCFEVGVGPFSVREAFGDDAVLIQSTGQPVLTNEWGVTLQPLQHGAFYYLLRPFTPSPHDRTVDLI